LDEQVLPMSMDTQEKLIDIVVPTHNHLELTITCMQNLYEHTRTPFHLIVVDDSTDGLTHRYFAQLKKEKKNITFIHSNTPYKSGNQFFNIAFQHTQSKFVATVMNSNKVEPDWEIVALHLMERDPKIGIIGFKNIFPDRTIESAGIRIVKFLPTDMGRGQCSHRLSNTYECDAVQWAFCLLRKEAIPVLEEDVYNGFRGWDDIDNCLVMRRNGWNILYCGLGVAFHEPRATRGDNSQKAALENAQNREMFFKRWGMWVDFKKDNPQAQELLPDYPKSAPVMKAPMPSATSPIPERVLVKV